MATTTNSPENKTIDLENFGPIERLKIPIPPNGGLVVLRGRNGTGKSTALNAIRAANGAKVKLTKRDGTKLAKYVGLGVQVTIRQSTQVRGEAEVTSIESKFDIATLIDPGFVDPLAADAHRVKALITLVGVEADPALFYSLVGGREMYEKLCSTDPAPDLPTLAARNKRSFEREALKQDEQAETHERNAKSARDAAAGIDLEDESDEAMLQDALESAIAARSKIESDAKHAEEVRNNAADANAALLKASAEYGGPKISEAMKNWNEVEAAVDKAADEVRRLRQLLAAAESEHKEKVGLRTAAESAVKAAQSHEDTLAAWQTQIDLAESVPEISADDIEAAKAAVEQTRAADKLGTAVRTAREKIAEAEAAESKAKQFRDGAEQLRAAAKGTNDVLSDVVSQLGTPLRVADGRLILDTARGETYFHELSMGERTDSAIDIGINAVGPDGQVTIGQEFYESLDPINERRVYDRCHGRNVMVVTAKADGGDLRAEVFSPNGTHTEA